MLDHFAHPGFGTCPARVDEHLHAFRQQRRRHRGGAARLQRHVRDPADMPQLGVDATAGSVHGIGHPAPALHLIRAMDARGPGIALALRADLGAFATIRPALARCA